MKLGSHGLRLIKSFEGFVPYVYDDLVPPLKGKYKEWDGGKVVGTLTIGYGHTDAAKHPLKCKKGVRITEAKATMILDVDLDECEDAVSRLVKVGITQGQFDALVSFTYNCGQGNLKKVLIPLNRGDYDGAKAKIGEFIRSKGKVLNGLVRRRAAEQALWDARPDEINPPPSDRPVLTPKEVTQESEPKSAAESSINWASLGTVLASIGGFLTDYRVVAVIAVFLLAVFIIWQRSGKPDIKGWLK